MRVRFKNKLGTTDEISASFAKKVIKAGIYRERDWISINGGQWKSCSKIKDIDRIPNYPAKHLRIGTAKVYYEDKKYNSFMDTYDGDEEQVHDYEELSDFMCSQHTEVGIIHYSIWIQKKELSINLRSLSIDPDSPDDLSITNTISCSAKDAYGRFIHSVTSDGAPRFIIASYCLTPDRQELLLKDIQKQICSLSHDNSISINANVRFEDGTSGVIDFKIPSIIINRLGKYLFVGDQYDEDFIINNNNEVLFIAENYSFLSSADNEDPYVPSVVSNNSENIDQDVNLNVVEQDNTEADNQDDSSRGCVYILINDRYPELVKIGKTGGSVSVRLKQLNTTGVPTPFECHYAAYVSDMHAVEKYLHDHFSYCRVNDKREFFEVSPREVHKILSRFAIGDATFS